MYHVVHLFMFFFLPVTKKVCWTLKAREQSLFTGLTVLGAAAVKMPLKLLKPQFTGRIISIQIYGPYLHINFVSLEELWKYVIFYTLP